MAGEVTYTNDLADHVSASKASFRWQIRRARFWIRLGIVVAILCIVIAAIGIISGDTPGEAIGPAIAAGVVGGAGGLVCVAISYLLLPRRVRRLRDQQRAFQGEQRVDWDDAGIRYVSLAWSAAIPWQDYYCRHETGAEFLLFLNEQVPHFVAKRFLDPAQVDDLRATLVAHGPPRR